MASVRTFNYEAVSPRRSGAAVKGTFEATSTQAVAQKLAAQGLIPLFIAPQELTGLNREIKLPGIERRVSVSSLAVFSRQLSALVAAGMPLLRAVEISAEQTEDKHLAAALDSVLGDLESGLSFSVALLRQPKVFPPLMVSLIRVGETGGFLDTAMAAVARLYAREADLHDKVKSAMTYPVIVAIIAVVAVIGMLTFIVPIFEKMFASLGGALPAPTQFLVVISHNMTWILPAIIVFIVVGWIWWSGNKNTDKVRSVVDPWKLKAPVFGKLNVKIAMSRFSRNLAMMLNAGVPLLQALTVVGNASGNWAVAEALREVHDSVRQGRSFATPLSNHAVFPPMVVKMIAVGEESGSLGAMLDSIADFYDAEVESATDRLTSTIEPLMIAGLGVVIGGMVIALYMPMFSIYSLMNGS